MIEQSADVTNDKWFHGWMTEILVNEVIKVINDRTDSCNKRNSSNQQFNTSNYGEDEPSETVISEGRTTEKKSVPSPTLSENVCYHHFNTSNYGENEPSETVISEGSTTEKKPVPSLTLSENVCYPSSIDFGIHNNSPVSKSSNQGEGDYQPILREATAFYQLIHEHNDLNNQDASTSSLITEHSDNELIDSLQNNIDALSFDHVRLSDGEFDSDAQHSPLHETTPNEHYFESCSLPDIDQTDNNKNHDQDEDGIGKSNNKDEQIRNSPKFCQVNAIQYFPADSNLPPDYFKLVNENYEQYRLMSSKEGEEEELLSSSSQELWIIESENTDINEDQCEKNLFKCKNQELTVNSPLNSPTGIETNVDKTLGGFMNWEEKVEVQVNVTEPITDCVHDTDISPEFITEEIDENNSIITSRTYWSNVGLVAEQQVARDYLGPTPYNIGFESMKGVRKVESKYLGAGLCSDQQLLVVEPQNQEEITDKEHSPGNSKSDSINYLSVGNKSKEFQPRKKKNIVGRISRLFSNIFTQKKNNKPVESNTLPRSNNRSS